MTRCFGWGLPKTSIIPFADCINHHNVDSTYEMINTAYHNYYKLEHDHPLRGPAHYYTPSKMEGNYADFFKKHQVVEEAKTAESLLGDRESWPNRTLNQIKKMIKRRQAMEMKLEEIKDSQTKEIWDVDYMSTSDEEDNDSGDEDDQEEEETVSKTLKKKSKNTDKDVIRKLLEQDQDLYQRDL